MGHWQINVGLCFCTNRILIKYIEFVQQFYNIHRIRTINVNHPIGCVFTKRKSLVRRFYDSLTHKPFWSGSASSIEICGHKIFHFQTNQIMQMQISMNIGIHLINSTFKFCETMLRSIDSCHCIRCTNHWLTQQTFNFGMSNSMILNEMNGIR